MKSADTIDQFLETPEQFGFCSFEDFRRNKEKWMGRPDDEVAAIDRGDHILGCKQKYIIEGYPVRSLEEAERVAREMGLNLFSDCLFKPQVRHELGSRRHFYTEVNIISKQTFEKRKGW